MNGKINKFLILLLSILSAIIVLLLIIIWPMLNSHKNTSKNKQNFNNSTQQKTDKRENSFNNKYDKKHQFKMNGGGTIYVNKIQKDESNESTVVTTTDSSKDSNISYDKNYNIYNLEIVFKNTSKENLKFPNIEVANKNHQKVQVYIEKKGMINKEKTTKILLKCKIKKKEKISDYALLINSKFWFKIK